MRIHFNLSFRMDDMTHINLPALKVEFKCYHYDQQYFLQKNPLWNSGKFIFPVTIDKF